MKKVFLMMTMLLLAVTALFAQDLSFTRDNELFKVYDGKNADTLNASYELQKTVYILRAEPYFYHIIVQADSSGDGSDIGYELQAGFDNSTWTILAAGNWACSEGDTTLIFNSITFDETDGREHFTLDSWQHKGASLYPYIRLIFEGTSGDSDMLLRSMRVRLFKAF